MRWAARFIGIGVGIAALVALALLSRGRGEQARIEDAIVERGDPEEFYSSSNDKTVLPLLLEGLRSPDADLARRAARSVYHMARTEADELLPARGRIEATLSHADPDIRNLGALILGWIWSKDLRRNRSAPATREGDLLPLLRRMEGLDGTCRLHFLAGLTDCRGSIRLKDTADPLRLPVDPDWFSPASWAEVLRLEKGYSCETLRAEAGRADRPPEVRAYACLFLWRALDVESLPTLVSLCGEAPSRSTEDLHWMASLAAENLCGASLARITEVLEEAQDLPLSAQMLDRTVEVLAKRGEDPPPSLSALLRQLCADGHVLQRPRAATALLLLDEAAGKAPFLDALGEVLEESRSTNRVTSVPRHVTTAAGSFGRGGPLDSLEADRLYGGLVSEMLRGVAREDRAGVRSDVVRAMQDVLRRENSKPIHPDVARALFHPLVHAWGEPTLRRESDADLRAWFDLLWDLQELGGESCAWNAVAYFGTHVEDDDAFMMRLLPYLERGDAVLRLSVVVAFDNYANRKRGRWEDRLLPEGSAIDAHRVDQDWLAGEVERWEKWWQDRRGR